MPALQAAVFPPSLKELPPPGLEHFDLDERFASEKIKMAGLHFTEALRKRMSLVALFGQKIQ